MYAIVDIAGKQFKVSKDQYIYAPLMDGAEGTAVSFDKVLLVENGGSVAVGSPVVKGAKVSGKILEHVKGNKVGQVWAKRRAFNIRAKAARGQHSGLQYRINRRMGFNRHKDIFHRGEPLTTKS